MNPCYSGFQVQGTATTPAGMTPPDAPKNIRKTITVLKIISYIFEKSNSF